MDNNSRVYAGFWIRCLAQIVDIAVWSLNIFIPFYLFSVLGTSSLKVFIPSLLWLLLYVFVASGLIKFFVHPLLISKYGAGLGKLVCGLEIIKAEGRRLTFKNALFREYIAKIASNALLGTGYYWIFKNAQRQGWHDGLAGTYVTKKHNGILTGLMVLIIVTAIDGVLVYQSVNKFKEAKNLQYEFVTLMTQMQQDSNSYPKNLPIRGVTE